MARMTIETPPARQPRRRPFTLIVLAGIIVLKAVLIVFVVTGTGPNPVRDALRLSPELGRAIESLAIANAVLALFVVLLVGSAVGLVARRRWGWLLAMVMTGLFVGSDIAGFFAGTANYLWMALNIATVFYLNQADVREFVGVSTEPLVPPVPAA
jgi:hypothetical protein